jgi:hypothetical protein
VQGAGLRALPFFVTRERGLEYMKLTVEKTKLVEAIKQSIAKKQKAAARRRLGAKGLKAIALKLKATRRKRARINQKFNSIEVQVRRLQDKIYFMQRAGETKPNIEKELSILRRLDMIVGDTLEVSDNDDYFKYI